MKLYEAKQILTENGFFVEGLDYYTKFYNDVWNKLEEDPYLSEYSEFYHDTYLNAKSSEIDDLIQQYWDENEYTDTEDCCNKIKNKLF